MTSGDAAPRYRLCLGGRDDSWKQGLFRRLAAELQRAGWSVAVEATSHFPVRLPAGLRYRLRLGNSLAVLLHGRDGNYTVLDCFDLSYMAYLLPMVWDRRCLRIVKAQTTPALQRWCPKVVPWTYFEADWPDNQERLVDLRERERPSPLLHFRGHDWIWRRPVLARLRARGVLNPADGHLDFAAYLEELGRHQVLLSLPGSGDVCYRDMEALATGSCLLRPRFRRSFQQPLVDGVHYVAVEATPGWLRPRRLADAIEARWRELVADPALRATVARNGARWYDENVRLPRSLERTRELLAAAV